MTGYMKHWRMSGAKWRGAKYYLRNQFGTIDVSIYNIVQQTRHVFDHSPALKGQQATLFNFDAKSLKTIIKVISKVFLYILFNLNKLDNKGTKRGPKVDRATHVSKVNRFQWLNCFKMQTTS